MSINQDPKKPQILHSSSASHQNFTPGDISVSPDVEKWVPMQLVSEKKTKEINVRMDPDNGQVLYESKKKGIAIIPLECVKEIRFSSDASYYRRQFGKSADTESRWITLIFILDGEYKAKHFVTPDDKSFELWRTTLQKLYTIRQGLTSGPVSSELRDTIWEKQYWKRADLDGDQKLQLPDVESLCTRLNLHFTKEELHKLFEGADTQKRGYLEFEEYRKFIKLIKRRPEIESIYRQVAGDGGGNIGYSVFEKFMRESQESKLSPEELKTLFAKHADIGQEADATMSEDAFSSFLRSQDNSVFPEQNHPVNHDMTRPISEYFICSSHNTYLIGHQLVGVSTIEGYIRALLHSCRTVELDIYDGDDGEPMVYHGKTLVSKVSVRDICQAIAKYAFVTSPYPIMISAEIHCGIKQQDVLVDIMHKSFGNSLISAPVEGRPKITVLPSPEQLKGKILLKAKNLHVSSQLEQLRAQNEAKAKAELEAESSTSSSSSSNSSVMGELNSIKNKLRKKVKRKSQRQKPKMSFSLASLLVYTVGVKCHGIKTVQYAPEHIFSLSENSANKMIKSSMSDLVKHTQTHMVRIYPKGTRVDSSNYEPHLYWAAGAQIVAINWQTFDLGYMINCVMFQRNGRSGLVLKPKALRPEGVELLNKRTKHFLDLTIISAQQLPLPRNKVGEEVVNKSIMDPLVEVSLHIPVWTNSPFVASNSAQGGVEYSPAEKATSTSSSSAQVVFFRTGAVRNNGFNPVWQEELCLPFDCLGGMKELIFVKFAVRQEKDDDDDEPLAVYCAPLGALEHGFRYLPLHDSQLSPHPFSTLFVEIKIRDVE